MLPAPPAYVWQQIELTPADFAANDGPTDPVDADGKLDLDALQAIGIVDVAQGGATQATAMTVTVH